MSESPDDFNEVEDFDTRLGRRLFALRTERGLSIEALAENSGVSRAMISRIERGESSPTAVVLNKLSIGLGMLLPALFDRNSYRQKPAGYPLCARREQAEWRDPASGYIRRTLTPSGAAQPFQLSEIRFPSGGRVTFENAFGHRRVWQQIWMLEGEMHLRLGATSARLVAGDCMAMTLDAPISFHNPGSKVARYLVAISDIAARPARRRRR